MITSGWTAVNRKLERGLRLEAPEIWLGVDSALTDGVRHAVDGQHIGGDPVVHAMGFGVPDNIIERRTP